MNKPHCDVCDKILEIKHPEDIPIGMFRFWQIQERTIISGIGMPLFDNKSKIMMCYKCVEDFKEFVGRKNDCLKGN